MVNQVILIGNLGADPELKSTNSGTSVCQLRIATSERRKDRDGNWGDHTEWHTVVCFGRTADNAAQYLKKGSKVYISGRLQTRQWQDRDGNKRYSTEVVCNELKFLDSRGDSPGSSRGGGSRGGQRPGNDYNGGYSGGNGGGGDMPYSNDDIPF